MVAAEHLIPWGGEGEGSEPVQRRLLRIRNQSQKGQVLPQWMSPGQLPKATGTEGEKIPPGKVQIRDLSYRSFDLPG